VNTWLWIILAPIAFVFWFVFSFATAVGMYLMLNLWKAGKHPAIDYSNWLGRLLGFVQLSRHIPKLMRAVFVWEYSDVHGKSPVELEPGTYVIARATDLPGRTAPKGTKVVRITRPLLNMNRQDLMEQLGFRPDDGRVT